MMSGKHDQAAPKPATDLSPTTSTSAALIARSKYAGVTATSSLLRFGAAVSLCIFSPAAGNSCPTRTGIIGRL